MRESQSSEAGDGEGKEKTPEIRWIHRFETLPRGMECGFWDVGWEMFFYICIQIRDVTSGKFTVA